MTCETVDWAMDTKDAAQFPLVTLMTDGLSRRVREGSIRGVCLPKGDVSESSWHRGRDQSVKEREQPCHNRQSHCTLNLYIYFF